MVRQDGSVTSRPDNDFFQKCGARRTAVLHGCVRCRRSMPRPLWSPAMPHMANAARRHRIPRPKRKVTNWAAGHLAGADGADQATGPTGRPGLRCQAARRQASATPQHRRILAHRYDARRRLSGSKDEPPLFKEVGRPHATLQAPRTSAATKFQQASPNHCRFDRGSTITLPCERISASEAVSVARPRGGCRTQRRWRGG